MANTHPASRVLSQDVELAPLKLEINRLPRKPNAVDPKGPRCRHGHRGRVGADSTRDDTAGIRPRWRIEARGKLKLILGIVMSVERDVRMSSLITFVSVICNSSATRPRRYPAQCQSPAADQDGRSNRKKVVGLIDRRRRWGRVRGKFTAVVEVDVMRVGKQAGGQNEEPKTSEAVRLCRRIRVIKALDFPRHRFGSSDPRRCRRRRICCRSL